MSTIPDDVRARLKSRAWKLDAVTVDGKLWQDPDLRQALAHIEALEEEVASVREQRDAALRLLDKAEKQLQLFTDIRAELVRDLKTHRVMLDSLRDPLIEMGGLDGVRTTIARQRALLERAKMGVSGRLYLEIQDELELERKPGEKP